MRIDQPQGILADVEQVVPVGGPPQRYRVRSIILTPLGATRVYRPGGGTNGSRRRSHIGSQELGRATHRGPSRTKTRPVYSSATLAGTARPLATILRRMRASVASWHRHC
jgi:hypothetical protein